MVATDKLIVPTVPDATASSGLAVIAGDGQLKQAAATVHAIKTAIITLTRAQVLAAYSTPIQLFAATSGVCRLPIKAIWKADGLNYYNGQLVLFYGSTYSSAKAFNNVLLTGIGTAARYNTSFTPSTNICENQAIYIGTNANITDSGTSDTITILLEYTEITI